MNLRRPRIIASTNSLIPRMEMMLSITMIQSLIPLIIMEPLIPTITRAPSLLVETKGLSMSIKPIME